MSTPKTISSADPVSPATERMLGLSDALFGIAITFLALDFGSEMPASVDQVDGYLLEHIPEYLAYVFSFLVVGFQWWRHHLVFRFIKKRTDALLLLNTTLLAFVALTPFGTEVLGHGISSPICLTFFAGLMFCIGMLLWIIWEYAVRNQLTIPDLDRKVAVHMRIQLLVMPGCFLLIMGSSILANTMGWHHDGLGLLLLLVLLSVLASKLFPSPSVGVIEREIESAQNVDQAKAERSMLVRMQKGTRSERLTVFTDGIFAVAFTILALRLSPPRDALSTGSDLMTMVSANSAALFAYFITFYVLSEQWMRHLRLFDRKVFADTGMLWINLVLLMFVAFMPFATELTTDPGGRTAILLYLSVLTAATFTQMAMEIYAAIRLASPGASMSDSQIRNTLAHRWGVSLILLLALTLAITLPTPEIGLFALLLFVGLDPVCHLIARLARKR
ncbi:MAG: hypothetical protein CMJ67_07265 [Planctomycetaceae bacterium]|nr:hypothetical protein [Planctomycetaceae bacterium]